MLPTLTVILAILLGISSLNRENQPSPQNISLGRVVFEKTNPAEEFEEIIVPLWQAEELFNGYVKAEMLCQDHSIFAIHLDTLIAYSDPEENVYARESIFFESNVSGVIPLHWESLKWQTSCGAPVSEFPTGKKEPEIRNIRGT